MILVRIFSPYYDVKYLQETNLYDHCCIDVGGKLSRVVNYHI